MTEVYLFYRETYDIVDHDENYEAVYELRREELGTFKDFNTGLELFKIKYPNSEIKFEVLKVQ